MNLPLYPPALRPEVCSRDSPHKDCPSIAIHPHKGGREVRCRPARDGPRGGSVRIRGNALLSAPWRQLPIPPPKQPASWSDSFPSLTATTTTSDSCTPPPKRRGF